MRTAHIGFGLVLAMLLTASCSKPDEKDPITKKCETACTLDPSNPCANQQSSCIDLCRSYGTKAQTFGGPKCADCVAGSFQPAVDATGHCAGFTHKAELTPECTPYCVTPDGAASGI